MLIPPMVRARPRVAVAIALVLIGSAGTAQAVHAGAENQSRSAAPVVRDIPSNPYLTSRKAAATELLGRLAAAQVADDPDAIAGLVDPGADPAVLGRLRASASAIAQLAPTTWSYSLDPVSADRGSDPSVGPDVQARLDAAGAADAWAVPVSVVFALPGGDPLPTQRSATMVLSKATDGTWKIFDDRPLIEATSPAWPGLWSWGPVRTHTVTSIPPTDSDVAARALVIGHTAAGADPGAGQGAARSADAAALAAEVFPAAIEQLQRTLPDAHPDVTIVAPASATEFAALITPDRVVATDSAGQLIVPEADGRNSAAAAVTSTDAVTEIDTVAGKTQAVQGIRIILNPANLSRLDARAMTLVLAHELFHVATRAESSDKAPLWVTEGAAEFAAHFGRDESFAAVAPALAAATRSGTAVFTGFPADAGFAAADYAELAYQQSWSLWAYLGGEFGVPALMAAYRTLAAEPAEAKVTQIGATEQGKAIAAATGVPIADFLAGWEAWVKAAAG